MKKILPFMLLSLLSLAALLYFLNRETPVRDISLAEIDAAFAEAPGFAQMERFGEMRLRRNFGLTASDFAEVLYYGQQDTMLVDVFLVIKMKDEAQAEAVMNAVNTYVAGQRQAFEGYGPEQVALLSAARTYQNGVYAALLVGDEAESWLSLIKDRTEVR